MGTIWLVYGALSDSLLPVLFCRIVLVVGAASLPCPRRMECQCVQPHDLISISEPGHNKPFYDVDHFLLSIHGFEIQDGLYCGRNSYNPPISG